MHGPVLDNDDADYDHDHDHYDHDYNYNDDNYDYHNDDDNYNDEAGVSGQRRAVLLDHQERPPVRLLARRQRRARQRLLSVVVWNVSDEHVGRNNSAHHAQHFDRERSNHDDAVRRAVDHTATGKQQQHLGHLDDDDDGVPGCQLDDDRPHREHDDSGALQLDFDDARYHHVICCCFGAVVNSSDYVIHRVRGARQQDGAESDSDR